MMPTILLAIAAALAAFNAAAQMDPAIVEKAGFIIPASVLYAHGRITAQDASAAIPDAILGVLFVLAFLRSASARPRTPSRP